MILFDKPFSQPEFESRLRKEKKALNQLSSKLVKDEKQSRESKGSLDKSSKLPLKNLKSSQVKAST